MNILTPTIKPTIKQNEAWEKLLDRETEFIYFGGGKGGGKSWLGCEWLVTNCYKYPSSRWYLGRRELKRLMATTFQTFLKVCKYHNIPASDWNLNGSLNYIEFINGSRIDLLDVAYQPRDPDYERFGSLETTGGWIDEAGEVDEKAKENLQASVGRHMNTEYDLPPKNLYTMNPNKGWIYKIYKQWKSEILPDDTAFIQSLYKDNSYRNKNYGKTLEKIKNKATRERLMYGNWEYDDDKSALFQYDNILDMFSNRADESEDKFLSGDVSRKGRDKMPIGLWRGLKLYKIITIPDNIRENTVKSSDFIKALIRKEQIQKSQSVLDEDGLGGGVVDQVDCKGFVNGSKPVLSIQDEEERKEGEYFENYGNLKAQCYFKLAELVERGKIEIDVNGDEDLKQKIIEELGMIKQRDIDKDEKRIYIISKDEIKKNLGRSPDYADMIMMRMYFLVKKPLNKITDFVL